MKVDDILTETPQLIQSLNHVDIKIAEEECVRALKSKTCTEVKRMDEITSLYTFVRNQSSGCYFLATDLKIDYLVNYQKVELSEKVLPRKVGVRQILIKRFPNASPFASGIGAYIFWEILFKEIGCLISDSRQTDNGRQFWEYRIVEAFDKNLTVRMINSNDNTFVDLTSRHELNKLNTQIWGKSKWFQRIIIAIF